MSNITTKMVGAGGFWNAIDERVDPSVVKQSTPFSCVAAVGEMLLRNRGISVTQQEIIDIIGEPCSIVELANFLNNVDTADEKKRWSGSIVERRNILLLLREGPVGVVLRDGGTLGHLVLIYMTDSGRLDVNDPWDGTAYNLSFFELFRYWNGEVIFRWNS